MQGSIAHEQGRSNRADQTGQVKQGGSNMVENWREGGTAVAGDAPTAYHNCLTTHQQQNRQDRVGRTGQLAGCMKHALSQAGTRVAAAAAAPAPPCILPQCSRQLVLSKIRPQHITEAQLCVQVEL
jgi:hypothetical protein